MQLAPIILFVYNRPHHTKLVLDALSRNPEAKQSKLYIFSDGSKINDASSNLKVNEVRTIIKKESRFENTFIFESEKNFGLASSIISGVSKVIEEHGIAIILEDDIMPSIGFLSYMNSALEKYKDNLNVGCIHAWNYDLESNNIKDSTFFLKGADCWGWGTWKRSWDQFNENGKVLMSEIENKRLSFEFNRKGTHNFVQMLQDQIDGKNDSWAIRWNASLFLRNMYCLHPVRSIVKNIGLDNSGVHSGSSDIIQNTVDFIDVKDIDVKDSKWFYKQYLEYMLCQGLISRKRKEWLKLKIYLKQLFHQY